MSTNEPLNNAADEVAAAEAELKAAQEKLEAAKAKLAETRGEEAPLEEETTAVLVVDEETNEVEAVIVEEAVVVADDAEDEADAEPEDKSEDKLEESAESEDKSEPEWVPYSTASVPPAPAAAPSYEPPAYTPPQQSASAPVPPVGATNGATASQQPPVGYAPGYGAPQTPHAGPGAVPPQQPYYGYQQPYYQQPPYAQPAITTKDHVAAGLLAIFLGTLGIHKFYLGYNTAGFIMLAVTILGSLFTFGLAGAVMWVIAIIEGILYLTKSQTEFEQIYVLNKREWF